MRLNNLLITFQAVSQLTLDKVSVQSTSISICCIYYINNSNNLAVPLWNSNHKSKLLLSNKYDEPKTKEDLSSLIITIEEFNSIRNTNNTHQDKYQVKTVS